MSNQGCPRAHPETSDVSTILNFKFSHLSIYLPVISYILHAVESINVQRIIIIYNTKQKQPGAVKKALPSKVESML